MKASLAAGLAAALLAFGVVAVTTGIGDDPDAELEQSVAASGREAKVDESSGRTMFARMACGTCHTLAAAGSVGELGPNLDDRLPFHTRKSLIAKITARPGTTLEFSVMPTDFAERMTDDELNALVEYLLAVRPSSN
jgi:mono/diheme cytochrome c family protein